MTDSFKDLQVIYNYGSRPAGSGDDDIFAYLTANNRQIARRKMEMRSKVRTPDEIKWAQYDYKWMRRYMEGYMEELARSDSSHLLVEAAELGRDRPSPGSRFIREWMIDNRDETLAYHIEGILLSGRYGRVYDRKGLLDLLRLSSGAVIDRACDLLKETRDTDIAVGMLKRYKQLFFNRK